MRHMSNINWWLPPCSTYSKVQCKCKYMYGLHCFLLLPSLLVEHLPWNRGDEREKGGGGIFWVRGGEKGGHWPLQHRREKRKRRSSQEKKVGNLKKISIPVHYQYMYYTGRFEGFFFYHSRNSMFLSDFTFLEQNDKKTVLVLVKWY